MDTRLDKINLFLKKRDLTRDELLKLTDISSEALYEFERGNSLTKPALERLMFALRIKLSDLDIAPDHTDASEPYNDEENNIDEINLANVVGERLKSLRKATGMKMQKEAAELLGVSVSRYNNWESGDNLIGVVYATKFAEITGANLDYIYRGLPSGLPMHLIQALKVKISQ